MNIFFSLLFFFFLKATQSFNKFYSRRRLEEGTTEVRGTRFLTLPSFPGIPLSTVGPGFLANSLSIVGSSTESKIQRCV